LAVEDGARKYAHPEEPAAPAPDPPRVNILVAEDNPVNRRLVAYMLEELGYEAAVVEDGARAVIEYARGRYGLVLMDCQMPVMDGYAAVAEIRRREGEGRHTPVVALSADAMKGTRERCLAAGMDDYLSKPFTTEQLGAVVSKWLRAPDGERPDVTPLPAEEVDQTLDLRLLERLGSGAASGNGARALQLVETFLSDARARRESLREAYDLRDRERLRREAHALKGGAGLFGAMRLSRICAGIVEQASLGDLPGVRRALEELDAELVQVTTKLEQWRPTL
ncbi:MAG TPA: response regulator, partial [Pyrinomonadaceae bacterium]|nr:response regulator [Pyrinomonadaceae bacterium]